MFNSFPSIKFRSMSFCSAVKNPQIYMRNPWLNITSYGVTRVPKHWAHEYPFSRWNCKMLRCSCSVYSRSFFGETFRSPWFASLLFNTIDGWPTRETGILRGADNCDSQVTGFNEKSALSRFQDPNHAPLRFAPSRFAPSKIAPQRFAR